MIVLAKIEKNFGIILNMIKSLPNIELELVTSLYEIFDPNASHSKDIDALVVHF